jgi:hypothetical protein
MQSDSSSNRLYINITLCVPEPPAIHTLTSPRGATSLTTSLLLLAAFSAATAAAVLPVLVAVLSPVVLAVAVAAVVLGLSEMRTGTPSEFLMRSLRCELRCDLHLLCVCCWCAENNNGCIIISTSCAHDVALMMLHVLLHYTDYCYTHQYVCSNCGQTVAFHKRASQLRYCGDFI